MPWIRKSALKDTEKEALDCQPVQPGREEEVVHVKIVPLNYTDREAWALNELARYAKKLKQDRKVLGGGVTWKKRDGELNEGGRLLLSAFRDARAEVEGTAQENEKVDVLGGETVEQFTVWYLMSVIDWCDENWLKPQVGQRSNPMSKYFTLASMFRKGKWQARATWPDPPAEGDGGPPHDAATATGMYDAW